MPITCPIEIRNLTQAEFDARDAMVMRCAYAAQNALGRLCDERVYENDLARRLRAEGFKCVYTQVPVTAAHAGFVKEYRLDLVADDALYELKTHSGFVPRHDAQALHYAMLADVNQVKLLNFRPERVRGKLVFNAFLNAKRRNVVWKLADWRSLTAECDLLKGRVQALVEDWGPCLAVELYEEALVHSFGGETKCLRRVPVVLNDVVLGSHAVLTHDDGFCFVTTAFTAGIEGQRSHLQRLLSLIQLRAIQWINFNHTIIEMRTIQAK